MPRLLVINPNTTQSITELVAWHVRDAVGPGFEIVAATGSFGCAYISSEACYAIGAHAALDCLEKHGGGCDAVLLACFGDPGLFALKEASRVPVLGLAEASMIEATETTGRFSIVTGGASWKPMLERFAAQTGHADRLASVRTVAFTGGQIAADPDAALALLAEEARAAAERDGAKVVILGGAGLAGLAARIADRVPVPVLDSVLVGARRIAALAGNSH
ncbi:MAG TPA: aspartate/glutamate racemase family protein [Burkholderiales bacterium]|nr:aspartate/glutamate racemase family protein [Burkholderiales bacterium]